MAKEFNFGNRLQDQLTNLARAELINAGAFLMGKITQDLRNEDNEKEYNGLVYLDNSSARLNTPKIISIRFEETEYFDNEGDTETTAEFDIELATAVVTRTRNVVVTPILNENGSIKQITGKNDFQVEITGFLIGNYNIPNPETSNSDGDNFETEYAKPTEDIKTLTQILETNVSLNVQSAFLDQFGISNLVIQSFSFPQDFETKNIQEFTIKAMSDDPKIRFI